ncbi:hypothetical protein [Sulfurimonas sp.]
MLLDNINAKLDEILAIHQNLPTWIPLSKRYAEECGYKTIDGLRKWCYNNLPPGKFEKYGKNWYVHISVVHLVKRKLV